MQNRSNCTINACVNIVYIQILKNMLHNWEIIFTFNRAKIYGKIDIADNCMIGANAVVNKSELKKRNCFNWNTSKT
jgi:serine acetyltransferase